MTEKEKLDLWFEAIGFKQNYVYKKTPNGWMCALYLPYIDKNIIGVGKTKTAAKSITIENALKELTKNDNALTPIKKILATTKYKIQENDVGGNKGRTLIIK